MKIVCDTNIFISSIIFGGNPERIIKSCKKGKIDLLVSAEILTEVSRVLKEKFGWLESDIKREVISIIKISEVIRPRVRIKKIAKDAQDNRILECASEGKADYIITGDKKHLLPLKKFQGIPIYSPQEFLKNVLYD